MHPDDEPRPLPASAAARRRLELRHARCRRAARVSFVGGFAGVLLVCALGLKPTGMAIPVFFAVAALLFAAASAALFARVALLALRDTGQDSDDDDRRGGGGPGGPPQPLGGGGLEFDWPAFERDFQEYCDRAPAVRAG